MNFTEIAQSRQSCRNYDATRPVEANKLDAILASARLAPSACNGQPYQITVCTGEMAKKVAKTTQGSGKNPFASNAPVMIVISESEYVERAAVGAKIMNNDYRSIDIGILSAYITAEATAQGLSSCILGWFDDTELRKLCDLEHPVRLVICIGHAAPDDPLRPKKRKDASELVKML